VKKLLAACASKPLLIAAIAVALSATAWAGTVTIDFEAVGSGGTDVGSFYNYLPGGPVFTGTAILQSPYYNYTGYPPGSGVNVAYSADSGVIDIAWIAGTSGISFYLDNPWYAGTVTAYDIGGAVISATAFPITTYGSPGEVMLVPGSGITHLTISGTAQFYVIDDVSYSTTVPEPGTIGLLTAGLLGLLFFRRRR
jgi:hypothetical protein